MQYFIINLLISDEIKKLFHTTNLTSLDAIFRSNRSESGAVIIEPGAVIIDPGAVIIEPSQAIAANTVSSL